MVENAPGFEDRSIHFGHILNYGMPAQNILGIIPLSASLLDCFLFQRDCSTTTLNSTLLSSPIAWKTFHKSFYSYYTGCTAYVNNSLKS